MQASSQPGAPDIETQVERIIASQTFQRSERLCRFLRFVVKETLAGNGADLKEYLIGVEVFDKGTDFDPRLDSAVRVDARRLRAKLAEYYAGEGASDRIRIDLPKGGYVPSFTIDQPQKALPVPEPVAEPAVPPPAKRSYAGIASILIATIAACVLYIATRSKESPSGIAVRSTAVLPFENLTGNPSHDALCDGLTEELIDRIARLRGLRVVSRTSSFAYKGKRFDARRIARDLKVDALIEGSVREGGESYRVTVQMIRGLDGMHIWSESFDVPKTDVLKVQASAAGAVEQRVIANLPDDTLYTAEWKDAPQQLDRLVTQAAYLAQRRSEPSLLKAIDYARQAIQESPRFAPAHAVLADSTLALASLRPNQQDELLSIARKEARRAIELDPSLAGPLSTLGAIKMEYEREWEESARLFRKALSLNQSHGQAHARYARLLTLTGRHQEAMEEARKAELLAPLSISAIAVVGQASYYARRFDEAVGHLRRALEIDPLFDNARTTMARAYSLSGNHDKALQSVAEMAPAHRQTPEVSALIGWIHARRGDRIQAAEWAARSEGASSIARAGLHIALGDNHRAIEVLEQAVQAQEANVVYAKATPVLDPLRGDPRLEKVCLAIGLSGCVQETAGSKK